MRRIKHLLSSWNMFVTSSNRCAKRFFHSFVRRVKKLCNRYGISLSLYLIIAVHCLGMFRRHRTREWQSVLYRGIDISVRHCLASPRVRSRGRANHGKAVPVPETGSEGISRGTCVYVVAHSAHCMCVYVRARSCWHGRTVPAGEKDIESDSRRTGHNFRPTRSELLMTSLPPPHHSRWRT